MKFYKHNNYGDCLFEFIGYIPEGILVRLPDVGTGHWKGLTYEDLKKSMKVESSKIGAIEKYYRDKSIPYFARFGTTNFVNLIEIDSFDSLIEELNRELK